MSDRAILLPAKFPIMLTRREYLKFKVIFIIFDINMYGGSLLCK